MELHAAGIVVHLLLYVPEEVDIMELRKGKAEGKNHTDVVWDDNATVQDSRDRNGHIEALLADCLQAMCILEQVARIHDDGLVAYRAAEIEQADNNVGNLVTQRIFNVLLERRNKPRLLVYEIRVLLVLTLETGQVCMTVLAVCFNSLTNLSDDKHKVMLDTQLLVMETMLAGTLVRTVYKLICLLSCNHRILYLIA